MQLREKLHADVSPMFDEATARRMISVVKRSVHATIHCFVLLMCFSWGFANSTAVHTHQCMHPRAADVDMDESHPPAVHVGRSIDAAKSEGIESAGFLQ